MKRLIFWKEHFGYCVKSEFEGAEEMAETCGEAISEAQVRNKGGLAPGDSSIYKEK